MAYVAVSGGKEAIEESIKLLDFYRSGTKVDIDLAAIENKMSLLVDRVMSEAGLYSKTYAALALKQCEGSVEEAVFLLRAYRSTLTRNYYTNEVNTDNMRITRRISAAFKDIMGGQILGATYDYTHRLINLEIENEESKSPTDEFLNGLKLDTSNLNLVYQGIVGFDHPPIFKILDILVNSDFLFPPKNQTKIFKETLNCYLNQEEFTLEEVGKQIGLTRERIRQIREKILNRLRYGFKRKQYSEFHRLFLEYIDSTEQPYIFITDEETENINNKEGTNFSSIFITYILSKVFYDYFDQVGKFENLFNKKRSKNSFHIQNIYLINVSLTEQFNFDKFIKYMESLVGKKHNRDLHITHQYLINNFKKGDLIDFKSVVEIINLILVNDFNSFVEISPEGFCLPHKGRISLKSNL